MTFPSSNLVDVIGPHDQYCSGALSVRDSSYVTAPIIEIGISPHFGIERSCSAEKTCSFDAAEAGRVYIGQTNAIIVSSFCGPHGLIWGMDLVRSKNFGEQHPLVYGDIPIEGGKVDIRSIEPLIDASATLFGSVTERRFPFFPGTHLPTAMKTFYADGPAHLFSIIGIGVPENPSQDARIFMEDVGGLENVNGEFSDERRARLLVHIARSIILVGKNQNIKIKTIYVGMRDAYVAENNIGCALTSIPYFLLPKLAIPNQDNPNELYRISLSDWEDRVQHSFLHQV